jgi:dihydrofolate reductase
MKVAMIMALSSNGYIARPDGDEDFLPHGGWTRMVDRTKKSGNLIWGRKTYENVMSWGGQFVKDLAEIKDLVIVTSQSRTPTDNITYAKTPREAVKVLESRGYDEIIICGGAILNTAFLNEGLVDELILECVPIIIPEGINLFSNNLEKDVELRYISTDNKDGVVFVHYEIQK